MGLDKSQICFLLWQIRVEGLGSALLAAGVWPVKQWKGREAGKGSCFLFDHFWSLLHVFATGEMGMRYSHLLLFGQRGLKCLCFFCQTSDLIAPTVRLQVPKLLCVSHEVATWLGVYLWGPMKKARTLNLSLSTLVTRFPWVLLGVNLMVTKIYLDVNRVIDESYDFVKYLTYPAQLYNFGWLHIILVQWRCWISS